MMVSQSRNTFYGIVVINPQDSESFGNVCGIQNPRITFMIIESFKIGLSVVREAYLGPGKSKVENMNDGYVSNINRIILTFYQQSTTKVFFYFNPDGLCVATIWIC
jgi:hypothetical protein